MPGTEQSFLVGFDPVRFERGLETGHDRAFQPGMGIAPMHFVLSVTTPLVGKSRASGETDFAIDHEHAPVGTAVGPIEPPGSDGMVIGEFAAGVLHHLHVGIVE